jgi:hypothetical protein
MKMRPKEAMSHPYDWITPAASDHKKFLNQALMVVELTLKSPYLCQ